MSLVALCKQAAMSWYEASSPPSPAFRRFPALPPELRLRIWHFALQTPYMIRLHLGGKLEPRRSAHTGYLYAAKGIPRPLLFVNCEARAAALSVYLPGFYDQSGTEVVWINPRLDTVYMDSCCVDLLAKCCVAKWIERVAFPVEDLFAISRPPSPSDPCPSWVRILCEQMTALKEVQLVFGVALQWFSPRVVMAWEYCNAGPGRQSDMKEARNQLIRIFIRVCSPRVEIFRRNLEQTRARMTSPLAQTPVVVRAVALGEAGVDTSRDHELEGL
jgi:hypothetical protein